eukprot:1186288-Prorocentrum_minimum.AAC.2
MFNFYIQHIAHNHHTDIGCVVGFEEVLNVRVRALFLGLVRAAPVRPRGPHAGDSVDGVRGGPGAVLREAGGGALVVQDAVARGGAHRGLLQHLRGALVQRGQRLRAPVQAVRQVQRAHELHLRGDARLGPPPDGEGPQVFDIMCCCNPLVTWQWRAPPVVGGCAGGCVRFARLALHHAQTYAPAASLTHPRAGGFEN